MPTEDDLRIGYRALERHTPDVADVLRAVYDDPRRSARSWRLALRVPRRHILRASLALGAAGAVTAVAVIAAVAHGPATKATPLAAPALRTRLLAAIGTASGDILYAHGGPAPGGGTWQSPAYPQPGQKVHIRILGLGSGGTIFKDGEYTFTMPSRNGAANRYASNVDQGGLQLSGTVMAVNHFRHVWGEWHSNFVLGFTLDAAGIRAEIANGQLKVVGPTELHGQKAVELEINLPPNNEAPPHDSTARLWVDATTYLPMQQFLRMSNGQQNVTDYTFLPPTAKNLANLRPEIPAGYTRAGRTQVTGPKPKTIKK
ncbi:MAG: hypothetical protein ACR2MP_34570 [Streptosporangiaceae bacterium]